CRERSLYDAHWDKEPFFVGMGRTELGALFSLHVQIGARVWWRMGGSLERGPLPAVIVKVGEVWRATSCRGLIRDFETNEDPPKLDRLAFATGKTREKALSSLAKRLGMKVELRKVKRSLES